MDSRMPSPPVFPGARQRGFTLIELMIVVTLLAVMLGIGIPSFQGFIAGQRVKTAAYDFATALLVARSEAIKRNTAVTISQTGSWIGGWTVAAGGTTFATQQALSNVTVTTNPNPTTSVVYQGNGRIASSLTFQFSGTGTSSVRCVSVNVSGTPNTTTTSCP
jgi:type IV fimbrial biogenesis protein FimT